MLTGSESRREGLRESESPREGPRESVNILVVQSTLSVLKQLFFLSSFKPFLHGHVRRVLIVRFSPSTRDDRS